MLKVENLMLGDTKEIESLIQAKQQISAILRGLVIYVQQLEAGNFSSDPDLLEPLLAISSSVRDMVSLVQEHLPSDLNAGQVTRKNLDAGGWPKFERKFVHDIRNPLGVVLGYSEILEETLEELSEEEGGIAWMDSLKENVVIFSSQLQHFNKSLDSFFPQRANLDINRSTLIPMADSPRPLRTPAPFKPSENLLIPENQTLSEIQRAITEYQQETSRVLVVDDGQSNRDLLCSMLRREGLIGEEAGSAAEALKKLEEKDYDLILLDLVMPGVTGYDLLLQLKESARWQHLPILMISGDSEIESAIRCIEVGAEDYLQKPFNRVLLKARISACIDKKRLADEMKAQNDRYKSLLTRILPEAVVKRLDGGEQQIADRFESTSILFSDLVGFTKLSARLSPAVLIKTLDKVFSAFDAIAEEYGVEKIKTIGDAYMAAAGLPVSREDHADVLLQMGLAMITKLSELKETLGLPLEMRVGIHSGPVAAGIIGEKRFLYDVWGDTVNIASRLEANGQPGHVHLSEETKTALTRPKNYPLIATGGVHLKGKGFVESYLITP